eukprot:1137918-Pelagomonas_calceolata.AAC.2
MGMEFISKFISTLVVQSLLFDLVKGVLSVAGTTIAKRMVCRVTACINESTEVCMLPLRRLQLLSRPCISTVLDFNQVHMVMVDIQLVGLSHVVGRCGPQLGSVSAA